MRNTLCCFGFRQNYKLFAKEVALKGIFLLIDLFTARLEGAAATAELTAG